MLKLEQAQLLDRVVDQAQPLMAALTRNRTVEAALQGRWAGHAVHPILVQVPLGTWMSAALIDATGADKDNSSSQLLTAVGLAGAVPAALTGWAELAEASHQEQRVGVVHAAANAAGMGMQLMAMRRRSQGDRLGALAWSGGAMGVLGAAGYLGGHLSVSRKLGSHDPVFTPQASATV